MVHQGNTSIGVYEGTNHNVGYKLLNHSQRLVSRHTLAMELALKG
jgi:hypothetical protein